MEADDLHMRLAAASANRIPPRSGEKTHWCIRSEHGRWQTRIAAALLTLADGGEVITECSIDTADGTKVADVAWGSSPFFARHGLVTPLPTAPEICVEIVSPSNSEDGDLSFFSATGRLDRSLECPTFPSRIARL